ncbi:MAG: efflux RND transporter periplasmic adaptor subunit [Thermoguttaceae bacterium]
MSFSPKSRTILPLFLSALTFLLGGGLVWGYFVFFSAQTGDGTGSGQQGGGRARRMPVPLVRVTQPVWQELGTIRPVHGRFVPVRAGTLSSEVSGIVREFPVEVGTPVIGGETVIARIDDTWTQLALELAENEIKAIQIKLDFETGELKRITPLVRNFTVTESDFLTQQARVDDLGASLVLAQTAKKEAEEKLRRTTIYAPYDGHIVKKSTELGDLVSPGTAIVELISSGNIDAYFQVGENVIDRINRDDSIPLFVDQLNLKTVGHVHSIVPSGSTSARFFPIYVRLDDQQGRLKAGLSVTGMITTVDPKPGWVVPKDVVIDKPDGQTVWVIIEKTTEQGEVQTIAEPIPVQITATSLELVQVAPLTERGKEILIAGANVVIEGAERLMPGQKVEITPTQTEWFADPVIGSGHTVVEPKQRIDEKIKE